MAVEVTLGQIPILAVRTSTATAAAMAAAAQRAEASANVFTGLADEMRKATALRDSVPWKGMSGCQYIGIRTYPHPCTPANQAKYVILQDLFQMAQRRLQKGLAMNPTTGMDRFNWMKAMTSWISLAHFATAIPAQFLYTTAEVESPDKTKAVLAFGPPGARDVLQRMLAAAGTKDLFLPIPIHEFFAFEQPHGLSFPWEAQERGRSIHEQKVRELRRGQERRAVRRAQRRRPYLPTALQSWLTGAGGTADTVSPALATVLGAKVPANSTMDVPRFHGRVPSPDLLMDYVRAWARHLATTPMAAFMADAGTNYMDYMEAYPKSLSGMTPQDIADFKRKMAVAKGQAISGGIFAATASVLTAAGVTAWAAAIVVALGVITRWLIKVFGGSLQGCPHAPRPFYLRSLTGECAVAQEAGKASTYDEEALNKIARNFELYADPNAEGPDAGDDVQESSSGSGAMGLVLGGAATVGLGMLLLRLIRR